MKQRPGPAASVSVVPAEQRIPGGQTSPMPWLLAIGQRYFPVSSGSAESAAQETPKTWSKSPSLLKKRKASVTTKTQEPCGIRVDVVGSKLVGVDIFQDGSESCLRSQLGTYKSPEHALAFKLLLERPDFLVLVSEGKITDSVIDKIAEGLNKLSLRQSSP